MIATRSYLHAHSVRQEAVRKQIVRLVFVVFLLLVFEGALRKWILPEFQRPLYFVRDPFVLLIYGYAFANGLILRTPILTALLAFAIVVSAFHLLLALLGNGHPISWALGVRHYFFYIPLAFVIGNCFRHEDLARLLRLNLLLAIPIAALAFLQHQSPPSAWINRALSEDIDSATALAGDILRPYGTFTHTSGHVSYVATSAAMLAAAWLLRRQMRVPLWLFVSGGGATMVMALTTGSRSIWLHLAAVALCLAIVILAAARIRDRFRAVALVVVAAVAVIGLYSSVLAPSYEAMLVRVEQAAQAESLEGRAVGMFASGFGAADSAPIQGFGLGAGILAATAATTGERSFALAETEWERIVFELGPIFGLMFIALRVALVGWLLWRALVANSGLSDPTGLMLFSFAGVHILVGPLTMSGMGAIFGWLFAGFILAATSPWSRPGQGAAPAVGRSTKRRARQRGRPSVLRGTTAPDTEPRLR